MGGSRSHESATLDREIIEPVAEIQVGVEDEIVQWDFADLHGVDSFDVYGQSEAQALRFPIPPCRPIIGSGPRVAFVSLSELGKPGKGP